MKRLFRACICIGFLSTGFIACSADKPQPDTPTEPGNPVAKADSISSWITTGDRSFLLREQAKIALTATNNQVAPIVVDTTKTYQTIDGFGYTLTGGSAQLINSLNGSDKEALLKELFGNNTNSIGVNYLRISMGASDLDGTVFSYNDLPAGQTDEPLAKFSLAPDKTHLIPVLKQILSINPSIKIMATPWSPPIWMKDNNNSIGGSLKSAYYSTYANYFVKYIQQMKAEGITIDAITPQNEPLHPGNNPSMLMPAVQQADFIKNHLGPAFQQAGIQTKIVVYDHNADRPDYPLAILNDAAAKQFVNGSAFHLYGGDVSALGQVQQAHPDKAIYFTEQWTGANGSFDGDLKWHTKNIIIGTMRNWSRVALEWNLANDPTYGPHTPGGCTECKGALTIGNGITRNVSYYIIAQASKFVPAGSVRIESNNVGSLYSVAFKTPEGKKALIVLNEGSASASFNIQFANKWAYTSLPAGAVGTYVW